MRAVGWLGPGVGGGCRWCDPAVCPFERRVMGQRPSWTRRICSLRRVALGGPDGQGGAGVAQIGRVKWREKTGWERRLLKTCRKILCQVTAAAAAAATGALVSSRCSYHGITTAPARPVVLLVAACHSGGVSMTPLPLLYSSLSHFVAPFCPAQQACSWLSPSESAVVDVARVAAVATSPTRPPALEPIQW